MSTGKFVAGEPTLKNIARELVSHVRKSVTIDWTLRKSAQAQIRVLVRRILRQARLRCTVGEVRAGLAVGKTRRLQTRRGGEENRKSQTPNPRKIPKTKFQVRRPRTTGLPKESPHPWSRSFPKTFRREGGIESWENLPRVAPQNTGAGNRWADRRNPFGILGPGWVVVSMGEHMQVRRARSGAPYPKD